ncbi:MAG: AzlD family protein [Halohasta sp.]
MSELLRPAVVGVILGMALVTYGTKAGGLWLLSRIELSERLAGGLDVLPGAIIVSILVPELADGGPPEFGAAGVVLLVAWRTDNVLLALGGGVGAVLLFRTLI